MQKIKLNPASALFMKIEAANSANAKTRRFVDYFDTSSADELNRTHAHHYPLLTEIVKNKFFSYKNYFEEHFKNCENEQLVVILSAGQTLLSLELLEKFNEKISLIVEIDISGMENKMMVYDLHYPEYAEKIKCITADIKTSPIIDLLNEIFEELYCNYQSLIIFEDLSCFLEEYDLEKLFRSFGKRAQKNTILMEYAKSGNEAGNVLNDFFHKEKSPKLITEKMVNNSLNRIGVQIQKKFDMNFIEKLRTGTNNYFNTPVNNFLETAVIKL